MPCNCPLIGCEHARADMQRPVKTWMGGSDPAPLASVHPHERGLITYLFHEQVFTYIAVWHRIDRERLRIFWSRARYDAHATYRS